MKRIASPFTILVAAILASLGWSVTAIRAIATETETNPSVIFVDPLTVQPATPDTAADSEIDQVTSVSQLTDVRPTDWAFQALQSLVERYGCIAGYPDRTYRGSQAMTRYEFAAGLNACLDRVNELIAASTTDLVKQEDLEAIKKLQQEFAAELATLRGRVDALEARTTTLEKQQFSTTTKLQGQIWFNLTGAFTSNRGILAERLSPTANTLVAPSRNPITGQPSRFIRREPQITLGYYAFLNFNTSFTGKDQLVTQLVAGNSSSPANELVSAGFFNSWGTPFTDQTGVLSASSVAVREFSYSFPVAEQVQVVIGPRINTYRYFDANRFTFFLTGAGSFNSSGSTLFSPIDRGSGAVAIWRISPQFRFTAAYLAENTEFLNPNFGFNTSSSPNDGLFNASNAITGELTFSPSRNFNLRLMYTRSNLKPNAAGFVGGAVGEPLPYGFADDGLGGPINNAKGDMFGVNFDWLISSGFGIFGRYGYGRTGIDPVIPGRVGGNVRVQSFQVGLGFPDLGKKGALGVVSFLVPHDYTSGRRFLRSGGGDGGTQYELEVSYFYPVNRNLALVPAFYAIFNPNNFDANPTVFVGNLRTQFSF